MIYARIENGSVEEYPLYEGDIRLRFPNVSFPLEFVPPEGYVLVTQAPYPAVDYTKNVANGTPKNVNGAWVDEWSVTDASPEEASARYEGLCQVERNNRNQLLVNCDWTQLPDAQVNAADWAAYRQQLRDVSEQSGFPFSFTWPTKPE
jgi:hypothetical protein